MFPPTLNDEAILLSKTIKSFVKNNLEPQATKNDEQEYFDTKLFKKLGDLGLLGLTAPIEYGGCNMGALEVVIAHEELSFSDPGFCLAYLAHSLLCVNNIAFHGNDKQKEYFLPKLCSGEWIGAMAMSEPEAGTDILSMKTSAQKKDNKYILNGRKMWITNGAIDEGKTPADCIFVYATTGNNSGRVQLSSFLVEKDTPGYYVGQKITGKLGMRASSTAEIVFDDCKIPKENLIGKEGDSIIHMMHNLEIERLGLAAMSLGIAKRCLKVMTQYATERTAFKKKLTNFGQIQQYIADSYAQYKAAKHYIYNTAGSLNLNKPGNRVDCDAVKLFASTMAKQVADNAIQILGGYGYVNDYPVQRLWRDAKLLEIGGGTLQAHQKNICKDLCNNTHLIDN